MDLLFIKRTFCLGLGKSIISGVRDLPIVGNLLSNVGSNIFSLGPGITEIWRVYADNPLRFLNALKGVSDDTSLVSILFLFKISAFRAR